MCAEYKRLLNAASSNKANNEKNNTYDDESGSRLDLLDIWRVNPAYRDINLRNSQIRLGNLQHVIMLDEIGEFLTEASGPVYSDDEHLAKYQVNKMWENLLGVFRSRGVSLISVDNKPSRLFESTYALPSIQLVFRTAHSCNHLFTRNIKEQEFLKGLEQRRAMVIDGVNGYKYEIFTPDFDKHEYSNNESRQLNT